MAVGDKLPVVMGREKAVPSGVATLGADGILAEAQRPSASQIMTADGSSVETALTVVGAPSGGIEGQALVSSGAGSTSRVKWGPWPSNPNLLDNGYFVGGGSQQGGGQFPINQRGKTEYTDVGCIIDRWTLIKGGGTEASISITNNGLLYKYSEFGNGKWDWIQQIVENLASGTYTLSFLINTIADGEIFLTIGQNGGKGYKVKNGFGLVTHTHVVDAGNQKIVFQPVSNDKKDITIIAAKLELGPVQTLAHKEGDTWVLNDPPPNYQQELEKCQRYQICFGHQNNYEFFAYGLATDTTSLSALITLPTTLMGKPTMSISGRVDASIDNRNFIHLVDMRIVINTIASNLVNVQFISTGSVFTTGQIYNLICFPGAKCILDKNL